MVATGKYNRKWLRLLFALYPLVSVCCFLLPFVPKYFINKALKKINGFNGGIRHIRITPFVINISIDGFFLDTIDKVTSASVVFISAQSIIINIDWLKLWGGTLSGGIKIVAPNFKLTQEHFANTKLNNPIFDVNLGMDIILQKFEIVSGSVGYNDITTNPAVRLDINNIAVIATSLSTVRPIGGNLLSDVLVTADAYEGNLTLKMRVNLFSRAPDFYLDAALKDINLVLLNNFFRAYGKFDIHKGCLTMYSDVNAKDGQFKGSVQSLIKDLEVLGPEDHNDSIGKYLWKSLIGGVVELLEDHSKEELDAKISFGESFKNPEIHVVRAVFEVLANAFLHGFTPYLKNPIRIDL